MDKVESTKNAVAPVEKPATEKKFNQLDQNEFEINDNKKASIENLCTWLASADVKIIGKEKQRNIATAICNDGWDTKDDLIDFFVRGDLSETMLNKFVATSGDRAKLARALVNEVENRKWLAGAQPSPTATEPKHVMLSYNWNQQSVAIELTNKLRSLGHDIWRGEDGSKVLGNMKSIGRINIAMEEVVRKSSCGIVFV